MAICKYCKSEKPDDEFKMCEACRKRAADNKNALKHKKAKGEFVSRVRGANNKQVVKRKKKPTSSLDDKIKKIDEYNKTHGTRLTYGKYMGLVYAGKI